MIYEQRNIVSIILKKPYLTKRSFIAIDWSLQTEVDRFTPRKETVTKIIFKGFYFSLHKTIACSKKLINEKLLDLMCFMTFKIRLTGWIGLRLKSRFRFSLLAKLIDISVSRAYLVNCGFKDDSSDLKVP